MLTDSPVYFLHAFLRNISKKYLKCLLAKKEKKKRIRAEKALSQQTNSNRAIVYLHDWAQNPDQLCVYICRVILFFMCTDQA